ncbi:MAG: hypothetical protein AAF654_10990 [Myxococcota bacterium]
MEVLGVLGAGQKPDAEDQKRVEERLQSEYAKLRARGRAPWLLSAVPDFAQNDLIDFVAPRCASLFRVGSQQLQSLLLLAREADSGLVRSSNGRVENIHQEAKYY